MKIKEWFRENAWWMIIFILIVSVMSIILYVAWSDTLNDKEVIVEGKIISVEMIEEENRYINENVLFITLDTGNDIGLGFKIITWEDYIDFTVNSKMILKLSWNGDDDYWEIESMYKVPETL